MRVAVLCSAHGFGHVTRQIVLIQGLLDRGLEVVLFTAAPREIVHASLSGVPCISWGIDAGIAQRDSIQEDLDETLMLLEERCSDHAIDRLARAVYGFGFALVDTAPAALEACRRAGVPAIAIGNFDWAWIYRHYEPLRDWADRFAAWQAPHPAIELTPGPGMHGFSSVTHGGLVGRREAPLRIAARRERSVLVSFGGFGLEGLEDWLPRIKGIRWLMAPPMSQFNRPDCSFVKDVPYPALVAGSDLIFTKPGYGIFAEAALAGTPIVWLDRGSFPEAPYLEVALRARGDRKLEEMSSDALEQTVQARLADPTPDPVREDSERIVDGILEAIASRPRF